MLRRLPMVMALVLVAAACQGGGETAITTSTTTTKQSGSSTTSTTITTTTLPPTDTAPTTSSTEAADLIFTGGPVVTMDPNLGTVEAIAIHGDTIIATGSSDEIARYEGPDTVVIDLEGRTITPGFVDAHTHILTDTGGLDVGQPLALENGITTLAEAFTNQARLDAFAAAAETGELRVRTHMYLVRTDNCGVDQGLWYEQYRPGEVLFERLRVAGVKIFSDGGTCGPLGASKPLIDGVGVSDPFHDLATLTSYIKDADDAGYQVIVHAQGDLAIAKVQDAYASVLAGGDNELRHRIDHNAIVTKDIASRYGELGLIPVLFGSSEACRPDLPWTDFYKDNGEEPREILAANPDLIVAWHGDDPWIQPIGALPELFSLVTRAAVAEDGSICEPPDWMAGEGVTVEQGLAMMTTGSAYALWQDDVVGSLTPGKLADLVVLSDNPLTVPTGELPDLEVLMTMIGGATEFCRSGAEAWCPNWTAPVGQIASASASRPGQGPELVLDGVAGGDSFWSSGADAPQWIQVDLPEPTTVSAVRFVVFQNPPGDTAHEMEVLIGGEWILVATFTGFTATGDVLTWEPSPLMEQVEALRMTTHESLSWPEWYEIEING
ncbi:MAG: amidohydrolase family protein [Acidimicrobiia bacterium]